MPLKKSIILIIVMALGLCGCPDSDSNVDPPANNYDNLISTGWSEFSNHNYTAALEQFNTAKSMNSENFEAYNGLGWGYFKDDQLVNSINEFTTGSQKTGSNADLQAGWAFVLNADKKYAESNIKIDTTLSIDPNWTFSHGLELNKNDLIVLKAENFFLLGYFGESLSAIQELNPSFLVNFLTSEGRAELALEIERLKGIN